MRVMKLPAHVKLASMKVAFVMVSWTVQWELMSLDVSDAINFNFHAMKIEAILKMIHTACGAIHHSKNAMDTGTARMERTRLNVR